jgi:ribonucleoside-diphosphate reductase beta chain
MPALLTQRRETFAPFLYPQAVDYYRKQTESRWEPEDINFGPDIMHWKTLDPKIKRVVAGVLRGFVQAEVLVGEYWSSYVAEWFQHPEVCRMAIRFGDMEGVHAVSYNQLSETLGIDSYEAFKADPAAVSKIEYLMATPNNTLEEKAKSLAIFSAFTEGVVLFSSFSILQWLKTQRLMPGVTSVIGYSITDESIHSEAGCWLFRTLLEEHPELNNKKLWADILEAANTVISLEHSFIDSVFAENSLPNLNPADLKEFIKFRANSKLKEIGSPHRIEFNKESSNRIATWFEVVNQSQADVDFFAPQKSNAYTLGDFKPNVDELEF